jgi:hypothetical protein
MNDWHTEDLVMWMDYLARVTYKPDYKVRVIDASRVLAPEDTRPRILFEALLPDSRWVRPKATFPPQHVWVEGRFYAVEDAPIPKIGISMVKPMPHWRDEEEAKVWLRGMFRELEFHELDEWFKVDGKMVNDPHKGDASA